jgi:hypothetical protein
MRHGSPQSVGGRGAAARAGGSAATFLACGAACFFWGFMCLVGFAGLAGLAGFAVLAGFFTAFFAAAFFLVGIVGASLALRRVFSEMSDTKLRVPPSPCKKVCKQAPPTCHSLGRAPKRHGAQLCDSGGPR